MRSRLLAAFALLGACGGNSASHVAVDLPARTVFYSAQDGLDEPLIDASLDESGDVWAVSEDALYVMRPQDGFFRRYTNADGLHIYSSVTAVVGGASGEGWVGLEGYDSDDPNDDPPDLQQQGKAEHVHLMSDGSITSLHYADLHNDNSANYWETRSARRLLYGHDGANAGHLYMGGNHGVTHILDDSWGDHVHVDITWPDGSQVLGEWYGLAFDPLTDGLWTCGRYGCGLQTFNPDPRQWVNGRYQYAFTVFTPDHGLAIDRGYTEDHVATAVRSTGEVWFASSSHGLGAWDPRTQDYTQIRTLPPPAGLGALVDLVVDPGSDHLLVADAHQVVDLDPASGAVLPVAVPSSDIRRLSVVRFSTQSVLLVATGNGVLVQPL